MDKKPKKPLLFDGIRGEDQEHVSEMPDSDFSQGDALPVHLCESEDATETIELSNLFTKEISESGSFDIRGGIWATTFGKVMQALPIPAFLVDKAHRVVVTNQACGKISEDYAGVLGAAFSLLFPHSRIARNVKLLLEKVFLDRKPRVAEAVLEIEQQRIWCRLTFRSIRIMDARFVFILVEDLSHEKRQLQLNERLRAELRRRVHERTAELSKINEKLRQEIAERERVEEALRESEERFRKLSDLAEEGIVIHDEGLIVDANEALAKMFGYKLREMIGMSTELCATPQSWKTIVNNMSDGYGIPCEVAGIRKDGSTFCCSVVGKPCQFKGKTLRVATFSDITDRKKSEEKLRNSEGKYRTILETIADGYHETDLLGNFTLVNDSMCEILGYSRQELLSINYRQIMEKEMADRVGHVYTKVFETSIANPGVNYEISRKDGSKRDVAASVSLIRDDGNIPIGFRGILRDITDRKRMEERLRHTAKTEAIGRLAGGIAHDFNNLLTAMIGYCNILHDELPKDEPAQEMLGEISHAAGRAATLTQQLLAFGRKQVLDVRAINLNEVVSDMGDLLKRLIGEQIELITDLEPDLGNVSADRSQVEQIILNLVVNARDATMPEGGTLMLETRNTDLTEDDVRAHGDLKPGPFAMVCVRDYGVGMDPDTVSSIFDPFFTTKEKGVGTGLGLSMVLGIVEQHHGHIDVESQPGEGSTFKIYLPVVEESEQDLSHTVVDQSTPRGQETLLVVEDEEAVRNLVCDALQLSGYALLSSGDPEEALQICNRYRGTIDLVLTDVVLPQMDGRSLYNRLAVSRPEMKVVFMSGYAENAIVHHGVLDPGLHFLQKPFTVDVLARKVREVLDIRQR